MANRPRSGRLSRADRLEETWRLRGQGLTHREIADRLNVSVSTVANDLRSSRTDASTADRSLRTDRREPRGVRTRGQEGCCARFGRRFAPRVAGCLKAPKPLKLSRQ